MWFLCPPAFNKGRVFGTALTTVSLTTSLMIFLPTMFAVEWLIILLHTTESSFKFRYCGWSFSQFYSVISSGMALSVTKLLAGRSGVQFPARTRGFSFHQNNQTGPGTRSASYWMNVVVPSSCLKGRDMNFHLMKRLDLVEIYSCSTVGLYDLHRDSFFSVFASDIVERLLN